MPNITRNIQKVKEEKSSGKLSKARPLASEKSKVSFKSRQLTLLRKDMKRDEHGEWYHTPTVTLAGQWLYDAGFRSGQGIEITVQDRQLIVRVVNEPGERPPRKLPVIEWQRNNVSWTETPQLRKKLPATVETILKPHKVQRTNRRKAIVSVE